MSDQSKPAAPGQQDKLPMDLDEEFRRARRNSLLWSAITIALALGSGEAVEVGPLVHRLTYDPMLLVVLSLAAAGFAFVGYIHADKRAFANNSEFSVAAKIGELADRADALKVETANNFATLDAAGTRIDEILARFDSGLNAFAQRAPFRLQGHELAGIGAGDVKHPRSIETIMQQHLHHDLTDGPGVRPEGLPLALARKASIAANAVQGFVGEQLRAFYHESMHDTLNPLGISIRGEIAAAGESMQDAVRSLAATATTLRTFSRAIAGGEMRWFKFYYRYPTVALFVLALSFTLVRGFGEDVVQGQLEWVGLDAVTEQASADPAEAVTPAKAAKTVAPHAWNSGGPQSLPPGPSPSASGR